MRDPEMEPDCVPLPRPGVVVGCWEDGVIVKTTPEVTVDCTRPEASVTKVVKDVERMGLWACKKKRLGSALVTVEMSKTDPNKDEEGEEEEGEN
jgi:hypothetical protein